MSIFEDWNRLGKENKAKYPPGTRIKLLSMNDPFAPVPEGTLGTVDHVDDAGTIHMRWDNGRSLGLVSGEDSFRKLTDEEIAAEQAQNGQQESDSNDETEGEAPVLGM